MGGRSDSLVSRVAPPITTDRCVLAPQGPLLAAGSTGSLPRNLAATLQDIEAKRQLALQQKGEAAAAGRAPRSHGRRGD